MNDNTDYETPPQSKSPPQPVSSAELLWLTKAYNRQEITFEEWVQRAREWAERIIAQYGEG